MKFSKHSLTLSLKCRILAGILVPIVVVMVAGTLHFRATEEARIVEQATTGLQQYNNVCKEMNESRWIQNLEICRRVCSDPQLIHPLENSLQSKLAKYSKLLRLSNGLDCLAIYNPEQELICHSGIHPKAYNQQSREQNYTGVAKLPVTGYVMSSTDELHIITVLPVWSGKSIIGYVATTRRAAPDPGMPNAAFVSDDNTIAYNPSGEFLLEYANTARQLKPGTVHVMPDEPVWLMRVPVNTDNHDLTFAIVGVDGRDMAASVQSATMKVVVWGLLLFAGFVVYGILTARKLTGPLNHLAAVAKQLSGGNRDVEWLPETNDETGVLNTALRNMTNELQEIHDGLEDQVKGRTTDLMLVNAKLAAAIKKAESANTAKSQFLANMSHEIRTPLNGIIGMTELALDTEMTSDQQNLLNISASSAHSLLEIINNILDFSKIEAKMMVLDSVKFPINKMVGKASAPIGFLASEKGLDLQIVVDPDVPDCVIGDPVRMRQVLTNLLGNALKFTPAGSVTLHVSLASLSQEKVTLKFQVSDTGIGISPEKIKSIFNAFEQADTSTSRQYGGTGLGLSISSKLVGLMGGKLEVHSKKDEGTSFSFILALDNVLANPDVHMCGACGVHTQTEPIPSLRILLAEDNLFNQQVAARLLKKWNHEVTIVPNGQEAVEAVANGKFDMILMDIQMPIMNGLEATAAIREAEKGTNQHLPIIAVTANAIKGDREEFLAAGMNAYVSKPINRDDIQTAMRECLQTIEA